MTSSSTYPPITSERSQRLSPSGVFLAGAVILLMGGAIWLRTTQVTSLPPWLWWDEAGNGLDARDLLTTQFRLFSTRSFGKEPLYFYLIVPFVSLWPNDPIAIRIVSAILGTLTVPLLFAAGRALWLDRPAFGAWIGLSAAGLWAVQYWALSINRLGFRVNVLPPLLTAAIVIWLLWTRRPTRRYALLFGGLAAATLVTYLSARATVVLWPALYLTLPRATRMGLRPTFKWAVLSFGAIILPFAIYFASNPQDMVGRIATFDVVQSRGNSAEAVQSLKSSFRLVAGTFLGGEGDPIPRHNLPYRPPFSMPLSMLFMGGLLLAGVQALRRQTAAWTLLLWLGLLALPAALSASSNPHFVRLFGALPAALLLAAWPLGLVVTWLGQRTSVLKGSGLVLIAALLLFVGRTTWHDYFDTWAQHPDLYAAFQGEMGSFGQLVEQYPAAIALVPLNPNSPDSSDYVLDYLYNASDNASFLYLRAGAMTERSLDTQASELAGRTVLLPIWHQGIHTNADPNAMLPFFLQREGELLNQSGHEGFDLLTFQLGAQPRFEGAGQKALPNVTFGPGIVLEAVAWGTSYRDRRPEDGPVTAGSEVWAILTWRLEHPLPDLNVAVDVVEEMSERRLTSSERPLVDMDGQGVSTWESGTSARSYHLLQVPITQPPGTQLTFQVRVYESANITPLPVSGDGGQVGATFGDFYVLPPISPPSLETLVIPRAAQIPFSDGVTFLGTDPLPEQVAPGTTLTLRMFWRLAEEAADPQLFTVVLGDTSRSSGQLPETALAGYPVHSYIEIPVPADTPNGTQALDLLRLGETVPLGDILVAGRSRRFEPPTIDQALHATWGDTITLLGTNAPDEWELGPGDTIALPLVWQAEQTSETSLVRFVHLLDTEGRLVAQEDTVPCAGGCPASSWLPGEVLLEEARVRLPEDTKAGSYTVAIGWYEAQSSRRLEGFTADGASLPDNLLPLPISIHVGQ